MADNWHKVADDIGNSPDILIMASTLGVDDPDLIVGKLNRMWGYASSTSEDWTIRMPADVFDSFVRLPGFSAAAESVGLLEVGEGVLRCLNMDRWNPTTALHRARTSRENGRLGGRPKNPDKTQTEPKQNLDANQNKTQTKPNRNLEGEREEEEDNIHIGVSDTLADISPEKPAASSTASTPAAPVAEFEQAWNEFAAAVGVPAIRGMTDARKKALRARWANADWRESWRLALDRARGSPFLRGENDRNWRMDVDFFLRRDSVTKILEGKYDSNGRTSGTFGSSAANQRAANNNRAGVKHDPGAEIGAF